MSTDAFVATNRFGLGARPGELAQLARTDVRAQTLSQLATPDPKVDLALAVLPSSAVAVEQALSMRSEDLERSERKQAIKESYAREQSVHLSAIAASDSPLRERLVAFWGNHLTISLQRREVTGLVASYEREVVRAHLDGPFERMLLASARHPAMLAYLDNGRSVGPTSMVGMRSGKGLNENYARELLELHTVGVNGGYSQADVVALANLLTGWTVETGGRPGMWPTGASVGEFAYHHERHQPGDALVMGVRYESAESVIRDLAVHPSTAQFVSRKLARAFVSDPPPQPVIDALAGVWRDTGGDLPSVHAALVARPEAWSSPLAKGKSPWDLVMSASRALQITDGSLLLAQLRELGQLPYDAPSPQGWPDTEASWLSPSSVLDRIAWAQRISRRHSVDACALAADVLGPVLTARSRQSLASADPQTALALLLVLPEFQRR